VGRVLVDDEQARARLGQDVAVVQLPEHRPSVRPLPPRRRPQCPGAAIDPSSQPPPGRPSAPAAGGRGSAAATKNASCPPGAAAHSAATRVPPELRQRPDGGPASRRCPPVQRLPHRRLDARSTPPVGEAHLELGRVHVHVHGPGPASGTAAATAGRRSGTVVRYARSAAAPRPGRGTAAVHEQVHAPRPRQRRVRPLDQPADRQRPRGARLE
jgi:hypothetical protein